MSSKQPGLKNGSPEEHSRAVKAGMGGSYICNGCGIMLSHADDPHKCPVTGTGETIEEKQAEVRSLRDYEVDIIEAAVALEPSGTSTDLSAAVDAYHAALRTAARKGK